MSVAYVVCIREIASGEDQMIGPFRSAAAAWVMQGKCERLLRKQGEWWRDGGNVDAIVEPMTGPRDWRQVVAQ